MDTAKLELRMAAAGDRKWIYRLRHDVYARELGQHSTNVDERLTDGLDEDNVYLVAARGAERIGFVSITPPWVGRYAVDKYVSRDVHPVLAEENLFEVRLLTVDRRWRGSAVAALLMHAALRWVSSRGGRHMIALGRTRILAMYLAAGLRPTGRSITAGAVTFELMHGEVHELAAQSLHNHGRRLRRLAPGLDWKLDMPFLPGPDACEHGGASFEAIGAGFDALDRRREIVAADVLDAWFPPAPGVVEALAEDPAWMARTSPPAGAEGLVAQIAAARGLPPESIAVGAGSSDLIFRAFRGWVDSTGRVLVMDPTYGEYSHVLERVLGCRVRRFPVRREEGWRIDLDRLQAALRTGYDLVVLVNPNNPTGQHVGAVELRRVLESAPPQTRIWLDEAYVEYARPGQSLESYAATSPNTVVCKSMSKVYALSGLRAAYLVASPENTAAVRRWTPPWPVSLPAQIAAVRALQNPTHYAARWEQTRGLRADLARGIAGIDEGLDVAEAAANFVLMTLPRGGPSAAQVAQACRAHGVFIRDLSPMSSAFEGRTLRVAVKDAATNAHLVTTLKAAVTMSLGTRVQEPDNTS